MVPFFFGFSGSASVAGVNPCPSDSFQGRLPPRGYSFSRRILPLILAERLAGHVEHDLQDGVPAAAVLDVQGGSASQTAIPWGVGVSWKPALIITASSRWVT
jgi:hypothetical protein